MKYIPVIVALAAAVTSATPLLGDIDLPFSELAWTGPIVPNGPNVTLTGTAKSVMGQIFALNPTYAPAESFEAASAHLAARNAGLEARNRDNIICSIPGRFSGDTIWSRSYEQFLYLSRLGGNCGVAARSCVRISCSWGSGVHLCNDQGDFIQPNCHYLAGYVLSILNECTRWTDEVLAIGEVNGQQFDTDQYNVIVSSSNC